MIRADPSVKKQILDLYASTALDGKIIYTGPFTDVQIVAKTGINIGEVRKALRELKAEGKLYQRQSERDSS